MDKAELIKQYGSIASAARKFGVPRQTLMHRIKKGFPLEPKPSAGKSLSDFRAAHDKGFIIPRRIKDALEQLGDGWEYEVPFAKLAGVSLTDLSVFREQFAQYIVVVKRDGKRAWAGTPAVAEKMRGMVR